MVSWKKATRKEIAAGIFVVVTFIPMATLRYYYTWHMPTQINNSLGRTVAVEVNHGKTVYVTSLEQKLLYVSYFALTLAVITALATYFIVNERRGA